MMNSVLMAHVNRGNAFPDKQRALRKGEWACTHALTLDQACVMEERYQRRRQLNMAWLNFAKAFDSIPHKYLQFVLESINIPKSTHTLLGRQMK